MAGSGELVYGRFRSQDLSKTHPQHVGVHAAGSAPRRCADVVGFTNGYGQGCAEYEAKGWCRDGAVPADAAAFAGEKYNFPERNCCLCGYGSLTRNTNHSW